jgi:hypothetical protein
MSGAAFSEKFMHPQNVSASAGWPGRDLFQSRQPQFQRIGLLNRLTKNRAGVQSHSSSGLKLARF